MEREVKFIRIFETGRAECETDKGIMYAVLKKDMPVPAPNSMIKVRGCKVVEVPTPA